jgi:hypothetical protein
MAGINTTLSFATLIVAYKSLQDKLMSSVKELSKNISSAQPGQFILLQFQMSQVAQIGDSISNLIAQVNTVISHSIQNQQK